MHIFHKWSKCGNIEKRLYREPIIGGNHIYTDLMQTKICEICGKRKRRKVK